MVEGRRMEPGICPQCEHVQTGGYSKLAARCPKCSLPLWLVAGKYRALALLNAGSFAWIYRAADISAPCEAEHCALKVFKPGMLDDVTEKLRFQREVKLTSLLGLETPHIVKIFDDFGFVDGLGHYYAMELLEGLSLSELLLDDVPLDTSLTFHILRQLCEALTVVHEHGVTHRDLKPDNIFLIERDGDPNYVKLIDFGIARHKDTQHRYLTQEIIGTPLFMSPEQCDGKPVDHRADVYALGMLLYRCLTGKIPFVLDETELSSPRRMALAIMNAQIVQQPQAMRFSRPDMYFDVELERAVLLTLSKDPGARPANVQAFWSAIAPFAPPYREAL